ARRHHVGVAEQHQHRTLAAAVRGPQVVDLAEAHGLAGEAGAAQAFGDERLATGVVRGYGGAEDQFLGELQHLAHWPKRCLKALSLKPWVMRPSPVTTTGRRMSCGYSFSSSFHSASEPGVLRFGARLRQVVDDLLTMASHPPSASRQASRVSGGWRWSR